MKQFNFYAVYVVFILALFFKFSHSMCFPLFFSKFPMFSLSDRDARIASKMALIKSQRTWKLAGRIQLRKAYTGHVAVYLIHNS